MTEEFKTQYDALENIDKAEDLAYTLGYDEAYLDGATITSPTYEEEMNNKISSLCNGEWNEKIKTAYQAGLHDGHLDT